jgi:phage terminase large subunit
VTVMADRPLLPRGTTDEAMRRLFPAESPYTDDPVGYVRDVLHFDPWSKQAEILEAVRDHKRVAVRSCHGAGKTAIAARAALWFLDAHPGDTRVITTGLSWQNVRDQLWKEIHQAHWDASLGGRLSDTRLELGGKRFAVGLSTDKPERFQGHHAENLLLIVDESSGLDERIFEAAAGYLTSPGARLLLIGNPTQLAGEFHAAFHAKRDSYRTIQISAYDTPGFTGERVSERVMRSVDLRGWVDDMARLYGEDSPAFQVRVLGEFPSTSDDTVCSLADVEAARARILDPALTPEPVIVACDVARFGSDETVIATRQGPRVRIARHYVGRDTMRTVGEVTAAARAFAAETRTPKEFVLLVVDDPGVGGGVTDRLRELGEFQVYAFNGAAAARTGDYPNRRSEAWFAFAEQLPEIDLDDDEQLAADLVAPKYKLDSRTRRVVEAKADTKKRLGRSPDRADAVLLAFSAPAVAPAVAATVETARRFDVDRDAYQLRRDM